jgi:hypothetical protein
MNGGPGWTEVVGKLAEKWEVKPKTFDVVSAIYTKWLLLEHSEVSVPANPHALTIQMAKGYGLSPDVIKSLGIAEDSEPESTCKVFSVQPIEKRVIEPVAKRVTPYSPPDVSKMVREQIEIMRGRC